ncbi:hypothetical protein MHU86_13962 [Fragilaria crotonensis]|nr:hypothetical protein MHU86_13962 [Fragilaria crotonensis]
MANFKLVVVYCDDCIVTGTPSAVKTIKKGVAGSVTISDLGRLKRHLGVNYEFGTDKNGDYILSGMTDYLEAIVRDYEEYIGSDVKERSTPGASVTPPLRSTPEDEIINMEMFRSFVGRILFACGKTEPTIANACRELTSHLTAPNEEHWNALSHLVGYLKTASLQGIKMRTPWLPMSIRTMPVTETIGRVSLVTWSRLEDVLCLGCLRNRLVSLCPQRKQSLWL